MFLPKEDGAQNGSVSQHKMSSSETTEMTNFLRRQIVYRPTTTTTKEERSSTIYNELQYNYAVHFKIHACGKKEEVKYVIN